MWPYEDDDTYYNDREEYYPEYVDEVKQYIDQLSLRERHDYMESFLESKNLITTYDDWLKEVIEDNYF